MCIRHEDCQNSSSNHASMGEHLGLGRFLRAGMDGCCRHLFLWVVLVRWQSILSSVAYSLPAHTTSQSYTGAHTRHTTAKILLHQQHEPCPKHGNGIVSPPSCARPCCRVQAASPDPTQGCGGCCCPSISSHLQRQTMTHAAVLVTRRGSADRSNVCNSVAAALALHLLRFRGLNQG